MRHIVAYVFFLLSYSPILCVSDDSNFGSNQRGIDDFKKRLRVSLFSVYLGAYKYYFVSLKFENSKFKFKVKHKISLFDFNKFTNEDRARIMQIQTKYLNSNEEVEEDKEFLIYQIDNQNSRKSIAYNKINTYMTIILALIPLTIIFYKPELFIESHFIIKVLTLMLFYIIGNICLYILQVNKVSEYGREGYANLKKANKKSKDIVMSYYLDYQAIRREADRLVSFVKNIEIYIAGAIICTLLLTIFNYSNSQSKYTINNTLTSISQIDISKLEQRDEASVKLINEINEKIPDKEIEKVIILYSDDELLRNESFNAIVGYFNIYRGKDDIILLKENDNKDENKIKIILVKE